jgi:hypothetical protein
MFNWINRINLSYMFVLLLGFHGLLYYALGTPNWFLVALMASLVDTGILIGLRLLFSAMGKQKGK